MLSLERCAAYFAALGIFPVQFGRNYEPSAFSSLFVIPLFLSGIAVAAHKVCHNEQRAWSGVLLQVIRHKSGSRLLRAVIRAFEFEIDWTGNGDAGEHNQSGNYCEKSFHNILSIDIVLLMSS